MSMCPYMQAPCMKKNCLVYEVIEKPAWRILIYDTFVDKDKDIVQSWEEGWWIFKKRREKTVRCYSVRQFNIISEFHETVTIKRCQKLDIVFSKDSVFIEQPVRNKRYEVPHRYRYDPSVLTQEQFMEYVKKSGGTIV